MTLGLVTIMGDSKIVYSNNREFSNPQTSKGCVKERG
ncbi:hypothetical protein Goshw_010483 [Gossypium schwendimanii]|uniref:Uncharacterized protein n=1 Tax=Gossypium schwendimanii TaxID=34291 RepID=A0A7J9N6V2_GOSSC|nr:hypothetical protein [Gossypium schwendimanii]